MTCGVYIIRCEENGKIYVGSSINIERRWTYHKSMRGNQVMTKAFRKYGIDSFTFQVIEECNSDDLLAREQHYLDTLRPFTDAGAGYNVRKVAENNSGIVMSPETRALMSRQRKGRRHSPQAIERMRETGKKRDVSHLAPYWGQPVSDESKRKISEANTGRTWAHDIERIQALRSRFAGKKLSPQHIEKAAAANRGQKRSDEQRKRMSDWQQRQFNVISPTGDEQNLWTRDLTSWLSENGLNRQNFLKATKTGKPYKGWLVSIVAPTGCWPQHSRSLVTLDPSWDDRDERSE